MIATSERSIDIEGIRASHQLSSVVGRSVKLQRAGREWKACCPFHQEKTPSFTVNDEKHFYHCFGCGAHGDVLDFVQHRDGVNLREAAERLGSDAMPASLRPPAPSTQPQRDTIPEAASIWRNATTPAGTPVQAYLAHRGLTLPIPPSIRFARLKLGRCGPMPALVALVASPDNKAAGIQRIFLTEDGRKADLPRGKVKFSLGRITGGSIRLCPAASEMVISGSLEDGLSLMQALGRAVWCAPGEGNLAGMVLPEAVHTVTIGADADAIGETHARKAAEAFSLEGRTVRIIRPEAPFKDFNAQLTGGRS